MFRRTLILGIAGTLVGTVALARPEGRTCAPQIGNTASLAATARETVVPDEAVVTLSAIEHGTDVAAATREVLRRVNEAIAVVATVRGIVAETTGFQTMRDYRVVNNAQVADGWTVRDEIVLTSVDFKALGQLTGRLARTWQVESTSTRISSGLRERVERSLTDQAIASFRARAARITSDFGLHHARLCTLDVGQLQGDRSLPRPMYSTLAVQRATVEPPLPIAPGRTTLSVTVSGSVRME